MILSEQAHAFLLLTVTPFAQSLIINIRRHLFGCFFIFSQFNPFTRLLTIYVKVAYFTHDNFLNRSNTV